jgi:all-trans-retinol 13,14-reductase
MVYFSSSTKCRDDPSTLVALLCMSGQQWAPWQDSRTGQRPQDYLSLKDSLAGRMFSIVKEQYREAAEGMELIDCYTPLTFRDYTLAPHGTAYGLMKSVKTYRSSRVTAATRIKGLYLAGHSVVLPGILGAVTSGVAACCAILDRTRLVRQIAEESA